MCNQKQIIWWFIWKGSQHIEVHDDCSGPLSGIQAFVPIKSIEILANSQKDQ